MRRGRQVGAVPAAHLAARRDGRPDAGQRADPRRDDGRRRRLPRGPALRRVPARAGHAGVLAVDRRDHHARRGAGRAGPGRHQAGARLLDGRASSPTCSVRWPSAATAPACFHLLTHARSRRCSSSPPGAVIHAVGTNLIADMGGLRAAMPVTFLTMTIGLGCAGGVPPLAGFFSKEAVLGAAEHAAAARRAGRRRGPRWLVLVAALVTVAGHRGVRDAAVAADVLRRARTLRDVGARPGARDALAADRAWRCRPPCSACCVFMPDADSAPPSARQSRRVAAVADWSTPLCTSAVLTIVASLLLAGAGGCRRLQAWLATPAADPATAARPRASGARVRLLRRPALRRPVRPPAAAARPARALLDRRRRRRTRTCSAPAGRPTGSARCSSAPDRQRADLPHRAARRGVVAARRRGWWP